MIHMQNMHLHANEHRILDLLGIQEAVDRFFAWIIRNFEQIVTGVGF